MFPLIILLRASSAEIVIYYDLVTYIFHANVYIFQKSRYEVRVNSERQTRINKRLKIISFFTR